MPEAEMTVLESITAQQITESVHPAALPVDAGPTLLPIITALHAKGYPKAFTLNERKLFNEAVNKHGLEDMARDLSQRSATSQIEAQNPHLDAVQESIQRLEAQRKKVLDERDAIIEGEDWDVERLTFLTARAEQLADLIAPEKEKAKPHILSGLPGQFELMKAQNEQATRMAEVQERVYLEAVHGIAQLNKLEVPDLEELIDQATEDDHAAAAEIIENGIAHNSFLMNRAGRRAAQRRNKRSGLN